MIYNNLKATQDHSDTNEDTITKSIEKLSEPSMFKVIILNDDFTPMDFVVTVLQKFFDKNSAEANSIMIEIHEKGAAVAGVFTHELAETKVFLVNQYSKKHQKPLKSIMEIN